jgi:ACS family glucarate transporter-like MFS transporter
MLSNGLFGYVAYVYLSWFYPYLVEVRGFSVLASSWYGTLPFIAITVLTPVGGLLSDRIARSHGKRRGRRTVVVIGMTLTSLFVAIGGSVANPYVAIAMLSLGAGFLYFSISPYWATIIDVAKSSTGLASGMMNTGGHIGGALSPTLTPLLAEAFGWPTALGVAAGAALLGGLVWFLIDADRPVQRRPRGADLARN